jgi:hypothetical protein
VDPIRTAASQIWTAAGTAIDIVRAVMTLFSQSGDGATGAPDTGLDR